MNKDLELKYLQLERSRQELFVDLSDSGEEVLTFKIKQEKWSITQVLFHVLKAEIISVLYLKKQLKNETELKKAGAAASARSMLLNTALKSDFKFKAPSIVANPPENYNIKELTNRWNKTRNDLKEILENFPEELYGKLVFKHMFAGQFNIFQTLDFFQNHFDHHKKQIHNLLKAQRK